MKEGENDRERERDGNGCFVFSFVFMPRLVERGQAKWNAPEEMMASVVSVRKWVNVDVRE